MSGKSIFRTSALAALAVAISATAIPTSAMAEPQRSEERGGRWGGGDRGGDRGGDFRGRAQGQAQTQARPQAQPQQGSGWGGGQQARPERSAPSWQGRGNADNAPRWGSQDRSGGQRPGRDWQSGTVTRPAPAARAATPATPQRGWDGTRWNPTNPDRNAGRDWNRNRDRNDGREWSNRDRDNRDGRGTTWGNRNDGRRDYRNGDSWRSGESWRRDNDRRDGWRGDRRDDHRRWSNDWRRDNRYNWYGYRDSHRHVYRMPRYYAPYRGYNYSRLSIGIFLNSGFYGSSYWINDPWAYRLPPAYGPYRWVRYYDDVLLVDTYSGEVVDVIYDFFW